MARKRDPRRIEAKNLWLESDGKMKLVDIAKKIGCSSNQIRKWKSTEKWSVNDEIESVPKSNSNVTNEKERYHNLKGNGNAIGNRGGAPPGNSNAIGNTGGSAPIGNKNAVTTGEYETLSWEFMTERERQLYDSMDGNLVTHINQTIRELEIRKRRMMERIANIEKSMSDVEKSTLKQLRDKEYIGEKDGKKVRLYKQELVTVEEREKVTAKIDRLLSLENSLNNVTNQLIRAIKQQSDLEQAELKKGLMRSQTSLNREKLYKPDEVNKSNAVNKPDFSGMSTEELRSYAASLRK
ncbi:hypothetical protein D4V23_13630 [Listeria monocytogenes]|nr:hypothetical protein [Listeria monocytogenes]EAH0663193.1 hypothetical protein [Listeria monocytogenes]